MPEPRIPCPAAIHADPVGHASTASTLPKRTLGSKTGPALKSKALRGDRTTAALVVSALLAGATPVCAQGWIEQQNFQQNFIIVDDHVLLRSDPTYRAACIVTLGIRDGKPTIEMGKECVLEDGSLHGKSGAALIFKRAP